MTGSLAIVGAATVLSGDMDLPVLDDADTVLVEDGVITAVGRREDLADSVDAAQLTLDANGATVAPGLIDSHCHVVLGDYTPRQKTVDFLASYVHGGITSVISPGEIHAPGRPHDAAGVKALAIAARACFENYEPGGMRVHAGAVVLEPTLDDDDFADLERAGVHLAKFGFGRYADPSDGVAQVRAAQRHGITVTCHSGGASVPGSQPIRPEHLIALAPDVCGHVNGGPTALDDAGVDAIIDETPMGLQLVQAGNLRSSIRIVRRALDRGQFHRILIGSDTPTGTGVMPLGVLKTVAELSSLAGVSPSLVWAAATGNNARTWRIPGGFIKPGAVADLVVMDAPWGSAADDALAALAIGDLPGITAVVTRGRVRTLTSRNTPRASRLVKSVPELPHLEGAH